MHYWHARDWWGSEARACENYPCITVALAPLSPHRLMPDEKRTWWRCIAENLVLFGPIVMVFFFEIDLLNARWELQRAGGSVLESIPEPPFRQACDTLDLPLRGYVVELLFLAAFLVWEIVRNWRRCELLAGTKETRPLT